MSDANLRRLLPESNSVIKDTDRVIVETAKSGTVVTEFGNIIFDKSNFTLANNLEDNLSLTREVSSDIFEYVDEALNTITTPEIIALYFKEFTNQSGLSIGFNNIATTNLSLEYFHVSTVKPLDSDTSIQFSVDASGLEDSLSDQGLNLSPGIYKVECIGAFTLAGPAGGFQPDGKSFGNGDRGYLSLELYKDTEPNESLLVSTPIIDYAPSVTLTTAPSTWCGTQREWEEFLLSNYNTPSSHSTYMYGFISICKTSNIKLKVHTAGSYNVGYPHPDSESELPPSLYNPIQIIFEKITEDPFEFNIFGPEVDILTTIPQLRTTTTTTTTRGPEEPTTTTLRPGTTTVPPARQPSGHKLFTRVGAHSWIVPRGVTKISLVAVGGGGGGAATNDKRPNGGNGGDLRWRNDLPVTPGSRIWVFVGAGGTSYKSNIDDRETPGTNGQTTIVRFNNRNGRGILRAGGGLGGRPGRFQPANPSTGSTSTRSRAIGGGRGGTGGVGVSPDDDAAGGGGGGAGGYTGPGGDGGDFGKNGKNSPRGGGGGGSGGKGEGTAGGGGGGVGLFGEGVDGVGGRVRESRGNGRPGTTGSKNLHKGIDLTERESFGFNYGGGGGGKGEFMGAAIGRSISTQHGGNGAVRIIWGPGRKFPNNAK